MTNQNEKNASVSINIPTVLFMVFLILKLVGVISWSWWWITAPLWMPTAFMVILAITFGIARVFIRKKKENKKT